VWQRFWGLPRCFIWKTADSMRLNLSQILSVCALSLFLVAFAGPVQAQEIDLPISFTADQMDMDQDLGLITARGNVEVVHDKRTLIADVITYNQKLDILSATGNVTLLEPSGDVMFAEFMELDGDFKNGIVSDIRMILSDRSRVAANGGRRIDGDLDLRKAVYSPCNLCADDPTRPPLWQIKAIKVFHDTSRKVVEYSDAWLEIAGVPVFYTPFLTHPDPTVKRESGFLTPTFGSSTDLGATLKTPYFWNISEQSDATFTPAVYSDQGAGLEVEYRERLVDGEMDIIGSVANDDELGFRGHIDSTARFNVDRTWRWGLDVERASDDTYQRRYGIASGQTLTSNLFVEGFRKSNYFRADGFAFQGLRPDVDDDETPLVAPLIDFRHVGSPGKFGGKTNLDASVAMLSRSNGVDSYRVSARPEWETNYVSKIGETYRFGVSLDADGYYVSDHTPSDSTSEFSGATGRLFPQAKLDWGLPMVRDSENIQQIFEPLASLIVAPNGGNPTRIPNEDSQEFEFDETSLFRASRFVGDDKIEGGSRIDYGAKWGVYGDDGGYSTIFAGQSFRFREDTTFGEGTGLKEHISDFVAKIQISPGEYYSLLYRTRMDKEDFTFDRNELSLSAGAELLKFSTQYRMFRKQANSEFDDREDISLGLNSQFSEYWRGSFSWLHDLEAGETRSMAFGTTYEDECLIYNAKITRSFFEDRDLRPVDAIVFNISFKTLGDVAVNY
jgi:LPS-assembly protein